MESKLITKFWNTPNTITLSRLLVAPVLLFFMLFLNDNSKYIGLNKTLSFITALIFTLGMLTDIVDGYLARRYKEISVFGKFMDPLADKVLFLTAMIMMIPLGRIPAWIVAILFVREVSITALRGIAIDQGIVIAASRWGKYKSAVISSATVGLLLHYPFLDIQWKLIGWVLLFPAFALSLGSGLHYTISFFKELNKRTAPLT